MDEYGLDRILRSLQFDDKQIVYAKMLIIGRMVHPASERETSRWINENSAIKELLKTDMKVYDNALHRTAVNLWKHREIYLKLKIGMKPLKRVITKIKKMCRRHLYEVVPKK